MNFTGVKKTKCAGGVAKKKLRGGGMHERGKEYKILGGCEKN